MDSCTAAPFKKSFAGRNHPNDLCSTRLSLQDSLALVLHYRVSHSIPST